MASNNSTKDTGILLILLLGLFLPSIFVSGQNNSTTSTTLATGNSTALSSISTQSSTSNTMGPTASTIMSGDSATTTNSNSTSSASAPSTSTAISSANSSMATTYSSGSGSSNSSSGMTTAMVNGSSVGGGNTSNITSMSMISCPSFTCNKRDCYTMYNSQNDTSCAAGLGFCQLIRQTDISYTVGCSGSCAARCFNSSDSSCSVACCNSTGCLSSAFASMMMMMTTTTVTTSATQKVTKATTKPQTTAPDTALKCHQGACNENNDCYFGFSAAPLQVCSSSEPYCELRVEVGDSGVVYIAGCATTCDDLTSCTIGFAPCHVECCNATVNSCLWLNGLLQLPSFATRGPYLNTELIALLLCLPGISLLTTV